MQLAFIYFKLLLPCSVCRHKAGEEEDILITIAISSSSSWVMLKCVGLTQRKAWQHRSEEGGLRDDRPNAQVHGQTERRTDRQACGQIVRYTGIQSYRRTGTHRNRQTCTQTDRHTYEQTDSKQTDRWRDRHVDRLTYIQARRRTDRHKDRHTDRQAH